MTPSAIRGILQARTLEWVAISFSNAWKWKVKVKSLSHVQLFATPWSAAHQAPPSMGFSRQEYWSGLPLPSLKGGTRAEKINMTHPIFLNLHLLPRRTQTLAYHILSKEFFPSSQTTQFLFIYLIIFLFIYLAALDLSCSMWDLVPQPGIEPSIPALGTQES